MIMFELFKIPNVFDTIAYFISLTIFNFRILGWHDFIVFRVLHYGLLENSLHG